ncbi:uncharacterized protein LOC110832485 isoform X3 [Zootermopsis nevadensis]|uniref:uncharacterized protein LOC110832485 isoform X1 n=1 Tax=Zootermopsis nevadensis TaxID=136037 RepID=UPI000B8E28D5|nr:uncharacterized protein LOC110832485 isoform X1 [Zootermopsis nevadensis]XP_021925233.1 uncharacterized protein LOC110832485 isoform X3 [Zootermopsis nevadensis]
MVVLGKLLLPLIEYKEPRGGRNFIKENVRQLRKMESNWQNRKEIDSVGGMSRATKFGNVPAIIPPYVNGSQSKSRENTKEASIRISKVLESPSKLLEGSHSSSVGHMTQAGVTQKGHMRTKGSTSKGNGPKRNKDNNVITKGDKAELNCQKNMNLVFENTKDATSSTELSLDISQISSVNSEREPAVSSATRSMGCQTIDPKNFDGLYSEGVIKYPSTRQLPGTKLRHSENRLQVDKVPSLVNRTDSAASDMLTSNETSDPDIQKLSLSELKQNIDEPQEESPETDYVKTKVTSLKTRQRSPVQLVSSLLKAPSSYQRGVIPKYLQERRKEWQKKAEQSVLDAPDPACPLGHVPLPDSERKETLIMLRKSYTDLIQELNMMPVRMDTLRIRNRKIELEKQLNKIEEGIKVFSRPKVFVKIGA